MTWNIAQRSLNAALMAAALVVAQPAFADSIELNNFWAKAGNGVMVKSGVWPIFSMMRQAASFC